MEMDRPSIVLANFMDSIVIDETGAGTLIMVHTGCEEIICEVESNDTLRVLFNTALGHTCPSTKGKS